MDCTAERSVPVGISRATERVGGRSLGRVWYIGRCCERRRIGKEDAFWFFVLLSVGEDE